MAVRELDWQAFTLALRNANYAYLPLMFIWGSSSYLIRALRWGILLNKEKQISLLDVFWANMAGYLGNTILPARAGELVRAAYIAKLTNTQMSFVLATGLTERLIDVVALVIIGSLSLSSTGFLSSTLEAGLYIMGVIGIAGLLVIVLLPRAAGSIENLVNRLPALRAGQKDGVNSFVRSFLIGLGALLSLRRASFFGFLTGMIWLIDALGTVFLSYVLSLSLTLPQAFVLLAALGLSSAIPSTPGYVGVYQFAAVLALKPFGFSNANAVALVLFAQIMNLVVVGIWGMIAGGRFSKIATASAGD